VDFAGASANAGIGTRWARARIAGLEQSRVHGADPAVVRAGVLDLAKRFSLVTPYTSFVVVADESYAAGASGDDEDGELPQGGTYEPLLLLVGLVLSSLGGGILWAAARAQRVAA